MLQFTVDLHYFRSALAATKTHVSNDKEDEIGRCIDLTILPHRELLVTATGGLTVGMARVPIDEEGFFGELGHFSLTPELAGTIIDMFAPGKNDWNVKAEVTVTFTNEQRPGEEDITVATISVRRLGQLFGGDQLKVTTPVQLRKDLPAIWTKMSLAVRRSKSKLPPTRFDLKRLGAFRSAQTTYGEPLTVAAATSAGGSMLVFCGSMFLGYLTADSVELDDQQSDQYENLREHWAAELPTIITPVA